MTNEQILEDLKQLIDGRALATEKYIEQPMETKLSALRTELREDLRAHDQRMDARFGSVLDAIGERLDTLDTSAQDHEGRLQRLERRAA